MTVTQTEFTTALMNPDQTVPTGLVDPSGRPAGKRFDVYRNNVVVSLIDAMKTAFPVIHKLVGDAFFKAMAGIYVRAHPPTTPLLMFYGDDFPTFLEEFEHTKKLPYAADVARLELMRRRSYHARDVAAIDPNQLAEITPDDLMSAKFTLSPTLELITSPHPIHAIWNMNMIEGAPKPEAGSQAVLLIRPALDVEITLIDQPTYIFLTALKTKSLGDAYEAVLKTHKTFDLGQAIGLLVSQNIIVNIQT